MTIINYEDTEEQLPMFEDSETMPLFRETVKEQMNFDLNRSFEAENDNLNLGSGARRSCPDDQRLFLSSLLKNKKQETKD